MWLVSCWFNTRCKYGVPKRSAICRYDGWLKEYGTIPLTCVSTKFHLIYITYQISAQSSLENREHGRRDPTRWPRGTLYPQKLALTSPTSGGRSVGIVHLRTQATDFSLLVHSSQCTWDYVKVKIFFNPFLFASCTDTVKLLETWRGVLSSTPPYK
jgi:hypothetical protein